jgi:hypothetical protein
LLRSLEREKKGVEARAREIYPNQSIRDAAMRAKMCEQESALLRLERENVQHQEHVSHLRAALSLKCATCSQIAIRSSSKEGKGISLSSPQEGPLTAWFQAIAGHGETENSRESVVSDGDCAEEERSREHESGEGRGGKERQSIHLSLSCSLEESLSRLELEAQIEEKDWEVQEKLESLMRERDEELERLFESERERDYIVSISSGRCCYFKGAFEHEREKYRELVRGRKELEMSLRAAKEREKAVVEQNAELKKQVDELENDVITCLESESEKQKEFAWFTSHSNDRNTHLSCGVEWLEFERQRGEQRIALERQSFEFARQTDQQRSLYIEALARAEDLVRLVETLRREVEEREVQIATLKLEREIQEALIVELDTEVMGLKQKREELFQLQTAELQQEVKSLVFSFETQLQEFQNKVDVADLETRLAKENSANQEQQLACMEKCLMSAHNELRSCNTEMKQKEENQWLVKKSKALQILACLCCRALTGLFQQWRDSVVEDRQMKAKALKVVQRLRSRALVGCFELWRASVVEEKERQGLEKGLRKVHVLAHELKVQVGFIEGLVSSCPSLWQKLDAEMRLHDESPRRLQILRDYLFEIGATAYVVGEKELDREEMLEKVVSRRRVSRHLADVRGLNAGSALTPAPQQGQASMCGKILGTSSSSQKSQKQKTYYGIFA